MLVELLGRYRQVLVEQGHNIHTYTKVMICLAENIWQLVEHNTSAHKTEVHWEFKAKNARTKLKRLPSSLYPL